LKGAFDTYKEKFRFAITGSGRLDLFQRGGESLAGRYDPYFLFPFSPGELEKRRDTPEFSLSEMKDAAPISESTIDQWEKLGPFPEPFLSSSEAKSKRWWQQYKIRVTEEDIRDLTKLDSLDLVKELLLVLPSKVGNPLSINSLREDLHCAHSTMQRYIRTLDQVFITFELSPFSQNLQKVIRKEKKIYFFNFLATDDPGIRFENMVALLLVQASHRLSEQGAGNFELFYLRDQSRREIDFVWVKDKRLFLLEAKYTDTQFGSASRYYQKLLNIPLIQVVRTPKIAISRPEGMVLSIHRLAAVTG
jgi:predicted AAA+ superfamily ATPase